MTNRIEPPIVSFKTTNEWESWLNKHQSKKEGVWLRIVKSGSLTYTEALDVALCYGWIDGQKKAYDKESWLQKFTPRRKKSIWSKKNTEHAERLIRGGKMEPGGLLQVNEAKADGRWAQAYDPASRMIIPDDFLKKLSQNQKIGRAHV